MEKFLMEDLTWTDLQELGEKKGIVLMPVGATEPHGPHLTLMCDALHAQYVAKQVAKEAIKEFPIAVTPLLAFGCSNEHSDFPGYLSLTIPTFINVITELVSCLAKHGIEKIIIINGHGGNAAALEAAVSNIRDKIGLIVGVCHWPWITHNIRPVDHGGEMETSLIMHIHPTGVYTDRISSSKQLRPQPKSHIRIPMPKLKDINPEGYIGNPSEASAELGEELVTEATRVILGYLRDIWKSDRIIGQFI